jgi:hypothetical protein
MGCRRRAYFDQWPGRGPFSHLPPWQRPGHACGGRGYGRGRGTNPQACARFPGLPRWWWADPTYAQQPPAPTPQDEIVALEDSKKELGEEKVSIEQEISNIETQLTELKTRLESQKGGQ